MPKHAPPIVELGDKKYLRDAQGRLVPVEAIKAVDLLMDETVRKIIDYARPLSDQVARFKSHTFDDVGAFQALVSQEYGALLGGKKGNLTLTSFDGLLKVQIAMADVLDFGPELVAAKALIDECLLEWSGDSGVEIRALVNRVFSVEREGQINRAEMFMLLRVEIADARWQRAMQAIRDSIRVIGSKSYARFYERDTPDGAWRSITIDLAVA